MEKVRYSIDLNVDDIKNTDNVINALMIYMETHPIKYLNGNYLIRVTQHQTSTNQFDNYNTGFYIPSPTVPSKNKIRLGKLYFPNELYSSKFYAHHGQETFQNIWDSLNPVDDYIDGDFADDYNVPDGGSLRKKRRKSNSEKKRKVKRKTKKRRKSYSKKKR